MRKFVSIGPVVADLPSFPGLVRNGRGWLPLVCKRAARLPGSRTQSAPAPYTGMDGMPQNSADGSTTPGARQSG